LYSTPDLQFLHYFLAEELVPTIDEILLRMEKNPNWMKQRINEFNKAVKGFEEIGENLIKGANSFSEKDKTKALNAYEKFLNKDYSYWVPSIFIDMFDIFEEKMIEFIFKDKKDFLNKDDLQFLLLPDKSVFWKEKNDFENIRKEIKKKKLSKTDKLLWKLLKDHAKKYWWINNDYQTVKKLGASYFYQRLDETPENPFWKTIAKKKKELIKKYSLDKATVERLKQISDMVYLRDVRKKYTQIASYYISEFYHIVAKKMNIPLGWSDFVIPFSEYKKFLDKDKKFLKELEMRVKKGVWMLGGDLDWKSRTETLKAKELFALVEGNLKGRKIIYGNTASLGKARGTVKVVLRQSDFHKFNEGDVLITGMTRPEFVPLMKMASAIVTDEGGITCHAAIISRELSKPCVIGTQTATRAFKDGDLVEVNANHGYIKNLSVK